MPGTIVAHLNVDIVAMALGIARWLSVLMKLKRSMVGVRQGVEERLMSAAFELYTKLKQTASDDERAEVIAQAFDALEARFPQITDLATQGHVRETELRLQKEIREVEARLQKEIKEVEARLQKEIKGVELQIQEVEARLQREIKEVEARLQKEIREVDARLQEQIKGVELQIREVDARLQERISQLEVSLHQALAAQTRWLIGGLAILGVVLKLADLMIGP